VREAASRSPSQREKKQVVKKDFVNSGIAIAGDSPKLSSSEEYEDGPARFDEDERDERRNKPERVTVHLLQCFLQYALGLCLIQDVAGGAEARVRLEHHKSIACINKANITAEDDGGICLTKRQGEEWKTANQYLALLEAKQAFQRICYGRKSGRCEPIVSDKVLAQYLGEAVITWKANEEDVGDE
jgi:hypothetical protein